MSSTLAKDILEMLTKKDFNAVKQKMLTVNSKPKEFQAQFNQHVAEIGLDKLLHMIAKCSCGDWQKLVYYVTLLSRVVTTTAVVKRINKAKSVLQKLVNILANAALTYKQQKQEEVRSALQEILFILCACVAGSKPKELYWAHMFKDHPFNVMITIDGETYRALVANLLQALLVVHQCKLSLDGSLMKFIRKYSTRSDKDISPMPYVRIVQVLSLGRYNVFCSFPSCKKSVDYEGLFKLCGACLMTHYCSSECQHQHWRSGHRVDCMKTDGCPESTPVDEWCTSKNFTCGKGNNPFKEMYIPEGEEVSPDFREFINMCRETGFNPQEELRNLGIGWMAEESQKEIFTNIVANKMREFSQGK